MPFSQRDLEGYVCIDHRESPGLDHPAFGKGTLFKASTYTCPYCQTVVIINPGRTRDREFCAKLNRHICDSCGAKRKMGIELKPFTQIIEDFMTAASRGETEAFVAKTVKGLTDGS